MNANRAGRISSRCALVFAVISFLLGLTEFTAWHLGLVNAIQLSPGTVNITYSGAIALLVLGAGLAGLGFGLRTGIVLPLWLFAAGLAMAVILQHAGVTLLGTADVFAGIFHPAGESGTRMPLIGALTILVLALTGLALCWSNRSRQLTAAASILASIAFALSGAASLAYFFGLHTFALSRDQPISIEGMIGVMVIALGLLAIAWSRSPLRGAAPSWLPSAVVAGGVIMTISCWGALERDATRSIERTVQADLNQLEADLQSQMRLRVAALRRAAASWSHKGSIEKENWDSEVRQLQADIAGYQYISWIDSTLTIRWIEPVKGNAAMIHKTIAPFPERVAAAELATRTRTAAMTTSIRYNDGALGMNVYIPTYRGSELIGFAVGAFSFDRLFPSVMQPRFVADYTISIYERDQRVYGAARASFPAKWARETEIPFNGASWSVVISPTSDTIQKLKSRLPEVILCVGFLVSLLLGGALYLAQRARVSAEALREAKLRAEAATRVKSEFLANMSHEIRTPMTGVMGMISLVLETELSDEQREWLQVANASAVSLLGILNDILDISKIESGKLSLEAVATSLSESVDAVTQNLSATAAKKELSLSTEIGNVPVWVETDPVRLRQILTNLIGNAIKFTDRGSVIVRVDTILDEPEKATIRFSVRDTGIGIANHKQQTIFQEFVQGDNSISRKFGGTGLGLSITSRLVHMMGGAIRVESEPGQGSTFHVDLPFRKTEAPAAEPPPADPDSPALRILVAEDNRVNQVIISTLLEQTGHHVSLAADGAAAVRLFATEPFDLVLMDVNMPEMDGVEATQRIRQLERETGRHIPILALTASVMMEDRERYFAAGMDDLLLKPFVPDDLRNAVIHYGVSNGYSQMAVRSGR